MPDGQRHVDVAGFADRLAVIEGFHDSQQARMFLHQPRDGVEGAGALVAGFGPRGLRLAGGFDGFGDFIRGAFGDTCQLLASGGIAGGEIVAPRAPFAIDVMARYGAMIGQPLQGLGCAFGGGAVIHGVEDFLDGHGAIQSRAATTPNRHR